MRMGRSVLWLVFGGMLLTAAAAQQLSTPAPAWPDDPSARALLEVFEAIRSEYYLAPADLDEGALWQGAIRGMLAALPDRYARYADPATLARVDRLTTAQALSGIGVNLFELDVRSLEGAQLASVVPGGPAERAGLKAGDVLLELDGVDVRRMDVLDIRNLVLGERGTTAQLTVGRPGADSPLSISVTRGTVHLDDEPNVSSRQLADQVGYLRIMNLSDPHVARLVKDELRSLAAAGATALVLDLRGSGGGGMQESREVLDVFLNGQYAWTERYRGTSQRVNTLPGANDLPMVVLVDSRTISMPETVAAALQETGRAVVVGENTFGIGVTERPFDLVDGGRATLAMAELLTPKGGSVEGGGMTPDVLTPDTLRSSTIVASGIGAQAGQTVELVIDGVVVARTVASGRNFDLVGVAGGGSYEVADRSALDPATDGALQVAIDAVKALRDGDR